MSEEQLQLPATQTVIEANDGTKFIVKRPTVGDSLEIGKTKSRLLSGISPESLDDYTKGLANVLATLHHVVVSPEKYNFQGMLDGDDLYDVYSKYTAWQNGFFRPVDGTAPTGTGEA